MKTKHEIIILVLAIITIACLLSGFKLYLLNRPFVAFWLLFATSGIASLTLLIYNFKDSEIKYFVINHAGKQLLKEGKLKNLHKEIVEFQGSLKDCCNYLNNKQNKFDGIIIDETIKKRGKYKNGKWAPVTKIY